MRRLLRGEPGYGYHGAQIRALRDRIRRASANEWFELWKEAIEASETREDFVSPRTDTSDEAMARAKARRASHLASEAQYGRAMRTLQQTGIANVRDSAVRTKLAELHPPPPQPIQPIPDEDLPPAPSITEEEVLKAVRKLNSGAAPGPDRFPPRLLQMLATSTVQPEAGVTGLSVLKELVGRLARADLPLQTVPLLNPATMIPTQPRADKIRPIAIGTVLRRLVTKILLPQAISDSRDFLAPFQLGNSVRSGIDLIVHDTRRFAEEHGEDPGLCILQVDMSNAFNRFSRQRMLDMLPTKAPSLARFLNMIYGKVTPKLIFPSPGVPDMESVDGAEQGDPAATLGYSLVQRPLATEIDNNTELHLHKWYCDDGTFGGSHEDIIKVIDILVEKGPALGIHINRAKCRLYWPTELSPTSAVRAALPDVPACSDGIVVLGAPIGTNEFVSRFLSDKIDACDTSLRQIGTIGDARIRFHLHRVCASACRLQHPFKLVPPTQTTRAAEKFDQSQIRYYSQSNQVPVTNECPAAHQVRLPLRLGGHGLTPIAPLHYASYAASLLSADAIRQAQQPAGTGDAVTASTHAEADKWILEFCRRLHPLFLDDYGCVREHLRAGALAPTSYETHNTLYKAWCESTALFYWKDDVWGLLPNPANHTHDEIRRRVRYRALLDTPACHFLAAHPTLVTRVDDRMWSIMLRRHLGLKIFDETRPIHCAECNTLMDPLGDHASDLCNRGLGWNNRHNAVVRVFARDLFKAAGAAVEFEKGWLVPGLRLKPADLLVRPPQMAGETPHPLPVAYDVTVVSPYARGRLNAAAQGVAVAADEAGKRKIDDLTTALRALPGAAPPALPPSQSASTTLQTSLGWDFIPLAFDSLGTPTKTTTEVIDKYCLLIAARRGRRPGAIRYKIFQKLSFAIWSTCAASIVGRSPQHDVTHTD